jgi:hypothetical protein
MIGIVIALDPADDPFPQRVRGHQFLRLDGTVDSLEAALARFPAAQDPGGMNTYARFLVLRFRGRYTDALDMLDGATHPISQDPIVYRPVTLMRAMMLEELRQHAAARRNYRHGPRSARGQRHRSPDGPEHPHRARTGIRLPGAEGGCQP